jgi:hypothetical protein
MLELEVIILGYKLEIQRTQERVIELWCYKQGQSNVGSTMRVIDAWQLLQFFELEHNKDFFELCHNEMQEIILDLIIENKYQHRELPREWFNRELKA